MKIYWAKDIKEIIFKKLSFQNISENYKAKKTKKHYRTKDFMHLTLPVAKSPKPFTFHKANFR